MKSLFKRFNTTKKLIKETKDLIDNIHKTPYYRVFDKDGSELAKDKETLSESLRDSHSEQLANIDTLIRALELEKAKLNYELRYEPA